MPIAVGPVNQRSVAQRSHGLTKRMSKTLAAEIAGRTLEVINPANRAVALNATLRRHGFDLNSAELPAQLVDRSELVAWLLVTYAPRG
jgi:hypothetical protein